MGSSNNIPAKKPQFFKIILENTMHEKKLRIPRKFVLEYWNDLPEWVTLDVPDGSQWKIKLTKTEDGKVCMQQGWSDFAKHYSLSFGNLLVFNPNGESLSKFHVVIFDMSGTEIKYDAPIPLRRRRSTRTRMGHFDKEFWLPKDQNLKNAREDSPLPSHRTRKRKMADKSSTREIGSVIVTECGKLRQKKAKIGADLSFSSQEFNAEDMPSIPGYQPKDVGNGPPLNSMEKSELLRKAREFKSTKPSFEKIIYPSAVYTKHGNAALTVPDNFAKKYLTNKKGDVIIQDINGRTWLVSYYCSESMKKSYKVVRFRSGWKKFAKDNNLNVGDVCLFEMINCKNISLKVTIFRKSKGCKFTAKTVQIKEEEDDNDVVVLEEPRTAKNGKPSCFSANARRQSEDEQTRPKREPTLLENKKGQPYFVSEVKIYHKYYMGIPKSFVEETQIMRKKGVVLEDAGGRKWPACRRINPTNGRMDFRKGWLDFRKGNNIKDGDTCKFSFLGGDDVGIVNVEILRKNAKSAKKA